MLLHVTQIQWCYFMLHKFSGAISFQATRSLGLEFLDLKGLSPQSIFAFLRVYLLHCNTLHVVDAVVSLVEVFGD